MNNKFYLFIFIIGFKFYSIKSMDPYNVLVKKVTITVVSNNEHERFFLQKELPWIRPTEGPFELERYLYLKKVLKYLECTKVATLGKIDVNNLGVKKPNFFADWELSFNEAKPYRTIREALLDCDPHYQTIRRVRCSDIVEQMIREWEEAIIIPQKLDDMTCLDKHNCLVAAMFGRNLMCFEEQENLVKNLLKDDKDE